MAITLKAARINAGLLQKEVAEALDVSTPTIASYEVYKTSPDITMARKIAKLYGLTVDDIVWGE